MPNIIDEEFGEIIIRRSPQASSVKLRVAPNGKLRVSMPTYAPLFLAKQLIKSNRNQLREILKKHDPVQDFHHGKQIGKSHKIVVNENSSETTVQKRGLDIVVNLSDPDKLNDSHIIRMIRDESIKALRLEAKSYLPHRLKHIANLHGFNYTTVRFSHSGGRWGSCNSHGTISLNIALMKLPFELIDYVLIHELSHTVEMNHSQAFWQVVSGCDPNYKQNRKILKSHSPTI